MVIGVCIHQVVIEVMKSRDFWGFWQQPHFIVVDNDVNMIQKSGPLEYSINEFAPITEMPNWWAIIIFLFSLKGIELIYLNEI